MNQEIWWNVLMPGIKEKVNKFGGIFHYDEFVPYIIVDGTKRREISMAQIIEFAEKDQYKEIDDYLKELTLN